jgi:hypothetical protein
MTNLARQSTTTTTHIAEGRITTSPKLPPSTIELKHNDLSTTTSRVNEPSSTTSTTEVPSTSTNALTTEVLSTTSMTGKQIII